ncbi:kynurenine 3-monooxygenase [Trichonephila clavipes]|nr:kynurenine 3-monooxygenase [Trichonephila clavipes]
MNFGSRSDYVREVAEQQQQTSFRTTCAFFRLRDDRMSFPSPMGDSPGVILESDKPDPCPGTAFGSNLRRTRGSDKLDLTRFSGNKFRSASVKGTRRSSAPRVRNELKPTLRLTPVSVETGRVGSLCACILGNKGVHVKLYEFRDDIRKMEIVQGRSINLALSVRGRSALALAGLEEEVIDKHGIPMRGRMLHSLDGWRTPFPYDKEGRVSTQGKAPCVSRIDFLSVT